MSDPRLLRYWDILARRDSLGSILVRNQSREGLDADSFFETGREHIARIMREVDLYAPRLRRLAALDFGCGVGRLTVPLAVHFERVIGLDASPEMIAQARRIHGTSSPCQFILNRRSDLRCFRDGSFDLVHSALVLQHIPPAIALRYIGELVRVTAPGGLTIFQLPEVIEEDAEELYCSGPIKGSRVKRATPLWAVRLWRRYKYRRIADREPRMAMFGLPLEVVTEAVRTAGGTLLNALEDHSHGTAVAGFLYIVNRN